MPGKAINNHETHEIHERKQEWPKLQYEPIGPSFWSRGNLNRRKQRKQSICRFLSVFSVFSCSFFFVCFVCFVVFSPCLIRVQSVALN
jgi:hypothetical protein